MAASGGIKAGFEVSFYKRFLVVLCLEYMTVGYDT